MGLNYNTPHTVPTIEEEIQQHRFSSPAHRVQVNIIYTAAWINQQTAWALRPFDLTIQQFNILRILRGRGSEPSTVRLLTDRMLDKMSNASRLVDKLCDKGYARRERSETDRRRVDIIITSDGLQAIDVASRAVTEQMNENFGDLTTAEYDQLSTLLDRLRS